MGFKCDPNGLKSASSVLKLALVKGNIGYGGLSNWAKHGVKLDLAQFKIK